MIKNKYFNVLTLLLLLVSIVLVVMLRYFPERLSITQAKTEQFEYETKLFDKNKIMSIDLTVDEEEWKNLLSNATSKEYIACDITVNGTTFQKVGIRAKGNTSLTQVASDDTTDRYSFKVEFDHYIENQTCYGLDKLALNNIIQDNTYMKEYMAYDMLTYMGIPTSLFSFANITVNGEDWGLYLALEVPEESFAARNFGTAYGDLYKPESTGGLVSGNKEESRQEGFQGGENVPSGENVPNGEGFANGKGFPDGMKSPGGQGFPGGMGQGSGCDLKYTGDDLDNYSAIWEGSVFDTTKKDHKRVVKALKEISEGNLDGYLNVNLMLRYIAVNSVLVNYDSYFGSLQHNYYLYEKNGELTMLPWDYNLAFAGFQSNDATSAVNDPIDEPVSGTSMEDRPFVNQVLQVEEYMEQYHNYLQQLVDEYFTSGYYEETINQVDAMISSYVEKDPSAFCTYEEYKTAVENLKVFGELRAQSIQGQLEGSIPSTATEQKSNADALVDAGTLSITAMGTQGGGMPDGKGPMGNMQQDAKETFAPGNMQMTEGRPAWNPPSGERPDGSQKGPMDASPQEKPRSLDITGIITLVAFVIISFLALICVIKYKRRK